MDKEKIIHKVESEDNFILVSNYPARKEISHNGFRYIENLKISKYTVGMWIVIHKKQ